MKKAMKLVWMVLFALPFFTLTSCESDDNDGLFKDYSYLLGKSLNDVTSDLGSGYLQGEEGTGALYYKFNTVPNVKEVDVFFTFFDYNELGLIMYNKVVEVDVTLRNLTMSEVYNELTKEYGNPQMIEYEDEDGNVEDMEYKYTKGNKYVYLYYNEEDDVCVDYIDKKEWDAAEKAAELKGLTKGGDFSFRAQVKAAKAASKAGL